MKLERVKSFGKSRFFNFLLVFLCLAACGVFGCSSSVHPAKTDNPTTTLTRDYPAAETAAEQAAALVGTWRYDYNDGFRSCRGEYSYSPDGRYSGIDNCLIGGYQIQTWTTGNWRLAGRGVLVLQVTDYEPKRDVNGRTVANPTGDIFDFRFEGNDRIVATSRTSRILSVSYRVR
jgi:hypothetical protein